ncbi:DNA adenine methylase, partial [Fructilactobacillus lindneri]|uniref:DNA adenine methylase n=1 Tax=Fructilactobacillus lindneri TaxID=53444 RepID=UPI001CDA8608
IINLKSGGEVLSPWRSPLRYPGGKLKLAPLIEDIVSKYNINNYVEPFAGGAGIGIYLLLNKKVKHITLNDLDLAIYSFWISITKYNKKFLKKFDNTEININEWKKQKDIFNNLENKHNLNDFELLDLGFSTFFLNRTNFSGILRGATPVGGMKQNGKWKINYEYNKSRLRPLIEEIGKYSNEISVKNIDIISSKKTFLNLIENFTDKETLIFIDPPYVNQGKRLYLPIKSMKEHEIIAKKINKLKTNWVLTYDSVPDLINLYDFSNNKYMYTLQYKIKTHRKAVEFLALSNNIDICETSKIKILKRL